MNKKFTKLLAAIALLVFITSPMLGWAQESGSYTITAKTGSGDGTAISTSTNVSLVFTETTYPNAFTTATKAYYAGSDGIKLGASSSSGELTFSLKDAGTVYAKTIVVNAKLYNSSKATTISANGKTAQSLTADFADYTFSINEDITSITLASSKYCWVKSIKVTYGSNPTTPCDIELTNAPISLSFDLFDNATAQVIHYTTSSTGTVYVENSDYVNATVDQIAKTITVTPKAITNGSTQTITVHQEADDTYLEGQAQFTVNITDSTPAPTYVFNTDEGLEALNITKPASNAGTNLEENHYYVSGDVTMTITHGTTATRVWGGTSATDLRVYGGGGSLTFSVPSGYVITSIVLTGADVNKFNEVSSGEWSGEPSRTVTLTANGTAKINTISVFYEANATGIDAPEMLASCSFVDEMEVAITCPTENATIYYTTDNTNPETSSTRVEYTVPFTINATTTVKAVAYLNSNYSTVAEATYTRVYNITLVQTTGGTISANSAQAAAGTTIELTATANVGYSFGSWSVLPVSVTVSNNAFTMPADDVTVSATFTPSATAYTVSFSVNNKVEMTATVFDGGSIDLTKFAAEGAGYTFEGWSTTLGGEIINPQNTYQPTGNITLYPGVAPAPSGDEYTLVTNVNQLEAGNLVVIAANGSDNYAMSTTQNSNNRGKSNSIEKSSDYSKLSITGDDVCELTLGTSNNHWTLYDATNNGYLYAVSGQNYLRTRTDNNNDACGEWTIAISNKNATISSQGTTDVRDLKYNASSSVFSCYKSGQQTVYLYTKPASKSAKGNRDGVPTTSKVTGIAANVLVTVKSNGVVYLTGNNAGNAANLVVEDGGQLVTSANVQGTMQKTINGYTSATTSDGWYFISSPLAANVNVTDVENLVNASGTGYDLYYFKQNPTINNGVGLEWINQKNSAANFTKLFQGSGYLYANAATTTTLGFAGDLRKSSDASYDQNITYVGTNPDENMRGWNLVGNPFPSNAQVNMEFYKMNSNSDGINPTAVVANSVIAPTEGVFVRATEGVSDQKVTFTATTNDVTSNSKGRSINIDVTRQGEFLDRAIVNINGEGSLSKLFLNNTTTKVYFRQDQKDYAIVASDNENELPVSFKASRNGSYTLTVNTEELEMNYLHLIDNMTGMDIDLLQTPSYTFEANTTDYESRFKLVFAGASTGSATDETFAFFSNGNLIVNNEGNATLQVIDLTGRILSSESINGSCSTNINATPGVYMLRLINGDNVKVQKVVVR